MVESLKNVETENRIKVAVRIRPFNQKELGVEDQSIIWINGKSVYITNPVSELIQSNMEPYRMTWKRMLSTMIIALDRIMATSRRRSKKTICMQSQDPTMQTKKQFSKAELAMTWLKVLSVVWMPVWLRMGRLVQADTIRSWDMEKTKEFYHDFGD